MILMEDWLKLYQKKVKELFHDRVLFIGLQGSYARGEAKKDSDIDVVLLLDRVEIEDLKEYRNMLQTLPHEELVYGFVSGKKEISHWCGSELFQFYHDTRPIFGSLEELLPSVGKKEAQEAVLNGACAIYHAASHNFIHAMDKEVCRSLLKSAFFVMQAKYYYEKGCYMKSKKESIDCIDANEKALLEFLQDLRPFHLEEVSRLLLYWSSDLIEVYGKKK